MPKTSTIPPGLKLLLKQLNTCLLKLHRNTKIPRARLVEIYEKGDPMGPELYALLAVLGPPLVDFLAAAMGQPRAEKVVTSLQIQIRLINQGGSFNRQNNVVNHNNFHLHLTIVNAPAPKALGGSPQRWDAQRVQPGGQARQIGQPLAVLVLERAA